MPGTGRRHRTCQCGACSTDVVWPTDRHRAHGYTGYRTCGQVKCETATGHAANQASEQSHVRRQTDLLVEKVKHALVNLLLELLEALGREFSHSPLDAFPQLDSGVFLYLRIFLPQPLQAHLPLRDLLLADHIEECIHRHSATQGARGCLLLLPLRPDLKCCVGCGAEG